MSEYLRIRTKADKLDSDKSFISNLIDKTYDLVRGIGDDGDETSFIDTDGEITFPLTNYANLNYLQITSVWDETSEGNSVKGDPAPVEIQWNGTGAWHKACRFEMQDEISITSFKMRNPEIVNHIKIKVRIVIGAEGA